jgi:hypothetical protein
MASLQGMVLSQPQLATGSHSQVSGLNSVPSGQAMHVPLGLPAGQHTSSPKQQLLAPHGVPPASLQFAQLLTHWP